ncbi:LysR family transcriptional regulator [Sphingomonas tabacisoli]|uniref:LysR family transcriptional regulator n=1 Tax=Sphingomonas tabacisoli TaxID=2249466 RepID=A0ABW4I492_9SPHN
MIDPRALRTYLAVCREGSITGAARRLNISQPAVSVTIAQLEAVLKTSLLERGRSGVRLTAAGSALLRRAEAMEILLRSAEAEVALAKEGIEGPLRVGGTPGALVTLLPGAVRMLEQARGRFALNVIERPDRDLIELLRKGDIEIAFVTTGIEAPPHDIEERTCARDPFALVVGRQMDRLAATVSLPETANFRWVLPEAQGAFRRQVDALFIAAEAPMPREVIRCDSLLTTKAIVRDSDRVTILPREVVSAELSIGVLRAIRIVDVTMSRSVGVRMLAGAQRSVLALKLLEALDTQA